MWLIFGTKVPHHLGAWATKFQISNASFNELFTERNIKHKNQLSEACINRDSLSSLYWMLGHVILSINSAKTCTCTKACIGVINCQVVENER